MKSRARSKAKKAQQRDGGGAGYIAEDVSFVKVNGRDYKTILAKGMVILKTNLDYLI